MSELKYCCDEFKWRVSLNKREHPNIRIIRLTNPAHFMRHEIINFNTPENILKSKLRFFITEGYQEEFDISKTSKMFIKYCPFCGRDLYKFYKDDGYANEIEGETFIL